MTVTAVFFAHYQDITGAREQRVTLPDPATVRDFADTLTRTYPGLSHVLSHGRVAVNAEIAGPETLLHDGDEVACLPPVSGGNKESPAHESVLLTTHPLDSNAVTQHVESPAAGAIVTFIGVVRAHARGQRVSHLEYEAFQPLARKELAALVEQAQTRWHATVAIAHRLGRLEIGESSVVIAVAAAHRAEAFEACRWVIDTLKTTVPIWKKEYAEDGAYWIEGPDAIPSGLEANLR